MPSLSSVNLGNNALGEIVLPAGWSSKDNDNMPPWVGPGGQEQDQKPGEPDGIVALAAAIGGSDGLSVVNVMGNKIGKEQLSVLQEIMAAKPNLVSLCDIADDATEIDLSGLGMDADDARILASELPNKKALSELDLRGNSIPSEERTAIEGICNERHVALLWMEATTGGYEGGW
jgi:Ran GTPase-activating protein (RanGAP) involved in mRNA processing and transport